MPAKWSKLVEQQKRIELYELYVNQNKTIGEFAEILHLNESTVYDRLLHLNITPADRTKKKNYNNIGGIATVPCIKTRDLSEFFGIMLGDGCLTPTQITVTLGSKELSYVKYVSNLIHKLFSITPKTFKSRKGHYVIYFGSVKVVRWLQLNGLVFNKVKHQVKPPSWIFDKKFRMEGFLKGMFDTDGSIYKLRYGVQIAYTNRSIPLLKSVQDVLEKLDYQPSKISYFRVYVTKKKYVLKFIQKIGTSNLKHRQRIEEFVQYYSK